MSKRFWPLFLLLLVIFAAYGQTLGMYFWQDDSALMFKLQNPEGAAGSFGTGIIGQGAYKYVVTPFVPFFQVFGLEPRGFLAVGLLTYLLATAAFYLFAQELFKSKKAGFFATLVFAAGYVGSETMFRIINSWQTNTGIFLALLTFWAYIKYLRQGGLGKYFLSLGLFLATIELVFIRSHSLILPVLALDILVRMVPLKLKELPALLVRQLPFWFLWQKWYLADPSFGGPGIKNLIENVLRGKLVILSPLFSNIGNGLVPDVLQTKLISFLKLEVFGASVLLTLLGLSLVLVLGKIYKVQVKTRLVAISFLLLSFILNQSFFEVSPLWYRDVQSVVAGLFGLQATVLVFFAAYLLWQKNKALAVALPFGLILLGSQIFGYYTQYPTSVFHTTHRYFSYSFIGYSVLFGGITYLFFDNLWKKNLRWLAIAPLVFLVGTNLILGVRYQSRIIKERSQPSRKFYQDLKSFVPTITKGATFYFDVVSEPFYQHQFGDFFSVGSMPESTALAIYYQVDRYDLQMLTSFDELLFKLAKQELDIDNTYTFFYGPQGLVETTEKTRSLLANGSAFVDVSKTSPLTPLLLRIEARVSPAELPAFPYQHGGGAKDYPLEQKLKMLEYLKSRKSYYQNAQATSLSEWKFREVRNVVDGNADTVWQGHRIWWHEERHEQLTVDLGGSKLVSRVIWQNWQPTLTPTSYTIESSVDGKTWQALKEVADGPERKGGEFVVEEFVPTTTRFIRMDITRTLTEDSPAILEFEVVESRYRDVNPPEALAFFQNPFGSVANLGEWNALYSALGSLAEANINWETDKKDVYSSSTTVPIFLDGNMHSYEVVVPAGGTTLGEVKINLNFPARVTVGKIAARNLSIKELERRELIKAISEN